MSKMDPEIKQKWLEALRGGKYVQGYNVLHDSHDDAYCCLGVLWDCSRIEWEDKYNGMAKLSVSYIDLFHEEFGIPRELVLELADRNDDGEPFSAIADYIERTL